MIGTDETPEILFDGVSLLRPDNQGNLVEFNDVDFSIRRFADT